MEFVQSCRDVRREVTLKLDLLRAIGSTLRPWI